MTWLKVDDGFYDHPKIEGLSMAARGLWITAASYCSRHLTDGVISARQVKALRGTKAQIEALISVGIWVQFECDSGAIHYRFHDWTEYQPTKEQKRKERANAAERQRKSRERKRREQGKREDVTRDSHDGVTRDSRECHTDLSQRPDPTRPDLYKPPTPNGVGPPRGNTAEPVAQTPALIEELPVPAKSPAGKGTRLPEGWMPAARSVELVRSEHPHLTSEILEREHRKFCDYWASAPGQRGVKRDWDATWRNWIRRSQEGRTPAQRTDGVPMAGKKIQGYAEAAKIAYQQRMERENNA